MKRSSLVIITLLILAINALSAKADLYTYNFHRITSSSFHDLGDQLSVILTDAGSNKILFTFYNDVGIASSICDVYFDDASGYLSNLASIYNGTGVSFDTPANPGNLPGGQPFAFTADFSTDSDTPVKQNGIDSATESLGLLFNLSSGKFFSDAVNALDNQNLRIGLHVQAIGICDDSDSYINDPGNHTIVPVPGAAVLAMLGITIAGVKLRKYT